MDTLHRCCAGLDVHKNTVFACVRRLRPDDSVDAEVRRFSTMTDDLLALLDWLQAAGVTIAAMESTGVYWKPVFNILGGHVRVLLVNAEQVRQVEGRKTDVKDCEWIAQLLQHGLVRPSFIPPQPVRELRDLTRQRTQLVAERAGAVNRIQKVLEDANLKLASVASDVLGKSGRAMLEAIISGEEDPRVLARLALGRLKKRIPDLERALRGQVTEHHRFLLRLHLDHLDHLEALTDRLTARIGQVLASPPRPTEEPAPPPGPVAAAATPASPEGTAAQRLQTIPGIDRRTAAVVVAEIGADMSVFATAGHLASWAGLCPGNYQSAGKRQSGRIRRGNRWLKQALVQAAWAASRRKRGCLAACYWRWRPRLGAKRALIALAHTLLATCYQLLKNETTYQEPKAKSA